MWHLKNIKAKFLCSFHNLDYSPKQGAATLIFGNNTDSDSQNSNGSGKSALIEAIAVALTGEPLRKVNIDEIINDDSDESVVTAVLYNDFTNEQLTVSRKLSRKQPQTIQIIRQTGPFDTDTEEVVCPSVADYNKYILDQLNLSKDDIFGNFILTARKYKSFLASSDKEKKEIINRFSNGVLVDSAIESLLSDLEPAEKTLRDAEYAVAAYTGRVEALTHELEKAKSEISQRKCQREQQIKEWKSMIADKNAEIRGLSNQVSALEADILEYDALEDKAAKWEDSDLTIDQALHSISGAFAACGLKLPIDYDKKIEDLGFALQKAQKEAKYAAILVNDLKKALDEAEREYEDAKNYHQKQLAANEIKKLNCKAKIEALLDVCSNINAKSRELRAGISDNTDREAQLKKQLAGVIQCPKCSHEFSFDSGLDIDLARNTLTQVRNSISRLEAELKDNEAAYADARAKGESERKKETLLDKDEMEINRVLAEATRKLHEARQSYIKCETQIERANDNLAESESKLERLRTAMFDDVFETIADARDLDKEKIDSLGNKIKVCKGEIEAYHNAIDNANNADDKALVKSLQASVEEYRSDLEEAVSNKEEAESRYNELKHQAGVFVEFKTYLANTKINAIADITNQFLATIGSDIRVALSGYTILKSGKIRDKISVSLLRDGVDCGSFEKFSAGERVRVELASILSMNQLTNLNCEDGRGLDLLIADEVLDSADEQGLASVFQALNKTQVTSLVVSHGSVAENYPNKITVTKTNGISTIG